MIKSYLLNMITVLVLFVISISFQSCVTGEEANEVSLGNIQEVIDDALEWYYTDDVHLKK